MSKLPTVNLEEKDGESVVSNETSDDESEYEDNNKDEAEEDVEEEEEEDDADDDDEADEKKEEEEGSVGYVKHEEVSIIEGAADDIEEVDHSFQKLEDYMILSDLEKLHPESQCVNFDEVAALTRVVRDANGKIIDPLHKTAPFITKYEKARIIGSRAEQIERGAKPFVEVEANIINARTIAMMEYDQKIIPFIIARPLPNKTIEYWRLQDLEFI
jgi:DNA-directed RNA polymerase subunit K/omega